ncbi:MULTISPECIES: FkbM family methyltransferase [unclassified Paraflavitalea]|uniref:FkbM family methyltransferase n=1 Tax=unclassified Paraflavitalea TaxID=2798305 RepID=UPI003D346C3E
MFGAKFRKRTISNLKLIYKAGILKTLFILFSFTGSAEEIDVEWKGRHVYIRKRSSDFMVFRQIFINEQYAIRELPEKSSVKNIIDLGSNIGLSVEYFKMRFPNARIIAVEPESENFKQLLKNTQQFENIICLNRAIWNSETVLNIADEGMGNYGYMTVEGSEHTIQRISTTTIPTIMREYSIDFIDILKIDIEGAEVSLFKDNYTEWLSKTGCIIIELHDWVKPGCAEVFFKALSNYHYNFSYKGESVVINLIHS